LREIEFSVLFVIGNSIKLPKMILEGKLSSVMSSHFGSITHATLVAMKLGF
jgi:hypothetical protein